MTPVPEFQIQVEPPSEAAMAPFGWLLGKPVPSEAGAVAFHNSATDFWQEHVFRPGDGGETEILWVKYRESDPRVARLENHALTEQAVVPVIGSIIQLLAASDGSGHPDLGTAKAFLVAPGQGLCMRPGIWHATRTADGESTCLMLTRRSTTADLVNHLNHGAHIHESRLVDIATLHLIR
ncbi:MAG: ureidoglycolate lyase [Ferrovibrio sp.]